MSTRFTEEATAQLAPLYDTQTQSVKAQLPAIQQLYQTLYQGLEGQRQTETQNIMESASQRGVLRSSLPVDLQTQLGQALLQERGKLGAQQAKEIAGVNSQLGEIGIRKSSAIADLARALETQDLEAQKFLLDKLNSEKEFGLKQQELGLRRGAASSSAAPSLTKNSRGGWEVSGGLDLAGYARATGADLITLLLQGDAQDRQAANWYLEKINKYGTQNADKYFQELQRDRPTAFYRGG